MGIRGLTTFIANKSDYYLTEYELQNTLLVIDGWSLCCQLYCNMKRPNCIFGGDYDRFYDCVIHFFGDLSKCGVKPIVLLDGGWENEKKATVWARAKDKLKTASTYGPTSQNKFFPLILTDVFKDALMTLEIKFVMCPFEADNGIAAVAKILECPVLSYDSDFYIYGIMYIPFNTLQNYIIKNKLGYAKRCKIYRIEKLLARFKGLNAEMLPLASILLGNDYISRHTFHRFFNKIKLTKSKNQNEQQRRIATILNWMTNHTLNSAITAVLRSMPKNEREKVLQSVESIINAYSTLNTHMLKPLGFSEEFILERKQKNSKSFEFQEIIDQLENDANDDDKVVMKPLTDEENIEEEGEEEEEEENDDYKTERDFLDEEEFEKSVPNWFMNEHVAGNFPVYFINMITDQLFMVPTLIEDFTFPSAMETGIPIIKSIFSLLIPREKTKTNLQLVIREKKRFVRRNIEVERASIAFEDLRTVEMSKRKEFINNVLDIREENQLDDIPEAWRLYVAAIIFWMRQENLPEKSNVHLCCLLAGMLFGVIDKHIGSRMSKEKFEKNFGAETLRLENIRKYEKKSDDCDLIGTLELINKEDCIMAAPFFLAHFRNGDRLNSYSNKFNVEIVHAFAQFQSCLRSLMHLNALLGFPYPRIYPSELFNGFLLYNFYTNFIKRSDIVVLIEKKLPPQFFRLFKLLVEKIIDIIGPVEVNLVKNRKRRRGKSNKKNIVVEDECIEDDFEIPEKSSYFFDPNNTFSLLTVS